MKEILKRPKVSLALLAGIILPVVALICSLVVFKDELQQLRKISGSDFL